MKFREINNNDTEEILRQIKYDTQRMESIIIAIDNAEKGKIQFKGKPKFDTLVSAIKLWNEEFKECSYSFKNYSDKLNKIIN